MNDPDIGLILRQEWGGESTDELLDKWFAGRAAVYRLAGIPIDVPEDLARQSIALAELTTACALRLGIGPEQVLSDVLEELAVILAERGFLMPVIVIAPPGNSAREH